MTDATPIYSLPFYEDTDPPDIPNATEGLATAVETELARLDSFAPLFASRSSVSPMGTVNNSDVLVSDTSLLLVLPGGNRKYKVSVSLGVNGPTAGDISIGYDLSGDLVGFSGREFSGPADSSTGVNPADVRYQRSASATDPTTPATYGTAGVGSALGLVRETLWISTGTGGGTLTLQAAQATATSGDTTWRGTMLAERVA